MARLLLRFGLSIVLISCGLVACKKDKVETTDTPVVVSPPEKAREGREDLERFWKRAEAGDEEALAELANAEGGIGLIEGADEAHRRTALLAATYLTDYYAVAWLADVAGSGSADEKLLAASAFEAIASKRNPHTESEERLELGVGCQRWNALVAEGKLSDVVKRKAVLALRMLGRQGQMGDAGAR
ncbi:MAG: hypothetical protein KBF88_10555 [Polyangiaceae bacterium]|nr:hypothetical protein [Polyangiaceae bacterium]